MLNVIDLAQVVQGGDFSPAAWHLQISTNASWCDQNYEIA